MNECQVNIHELNIEVISLTVQFSQNVKDLMLRNDVKVPWLPVQV